MKISEIINEAFSQAAADKNKIKYQKQGRVGHGVGWKALADDPRELVDRIVHHFDNISRIVQYDRATDRSKHSIVERFFKKYNYPFEVFPDVIAAIDQQIADSYALARKNVAEDWNKVNKQDKTDGLSQKAVNAYRRENPGSKLKTAVTTKPSKLKPGSKAAKRRKSFCARMSGNKGPMKKPNGKPTPKALALRRWNCESVEEMRQLIETAEKVIMQEKWSQKYKSSINCSNPKGFSQKAHCASKKK
jgi:predicted small metal-binding protein